MAEGRGGRGRCVWGGGTERERDWQEGCQKGGSAEKVGVKAETPAWEGGERKHRGGGRIWKGLAGREGLESAAEADLSKKKKMMRKMMKTRMENLAEFG